MDDARPILQKYIEPAVLAPGITVRPTSLGFLAVELHYKADPIAFTPEIIAEEKRRMGGEQSWRWLKDYECDFNVQSGQPLFDHAWMLRQRDFQQNPIYCMMVLPSGKLERCKNGPIKIFIDPADLPDGLPDDIESLDRQFGMGIDTGEGVGGNDSTMTAFAVDTLDQAFEFRSNHIRPDAFGRIAALMAEFYNNALICPVRKMGHGIACIRAIVDHGYSRVWREKNPKTYVQVPTNLLGWPHGEVSHNSFLLDNWVAAIRDTRVKLHGVDSITEHGQFIYDDLGRPVVSKFKELPAEARARHGDLVVACALAYRACLDISKYRNIVHQSSSTMCFEQRRRMRLAERKNTRREW